MKRSAYIRQLLPALGANLAGMAAISLFLLAVGNSIGTVGVILAVWTVCFILYGELYFRARRRELEKLLQETYALKQRYLIAEVMKEPRRADDKVFSNASPGTALYVGRGGRSPSPTAGIPGVR